MNYFKQKFLKTEIEKLLQQGFIRLDEKEKIFNYYHFNEKNCFFFLYIFAALFFSFSLITIIGFHWKNLPELLRVGILLSVLFLTQCGIYFNENKIYKNSFAFFSGFVLLGNLALLSQMYHLGDDTSLALISTAFVMFFLAVVLQSKIVFLESYLFAAAGFFWDMPEFFSYSFLFFISIGFIIQKIKPSKFLSFCNFVFLCFYIIESPLFLKMHWELNQIFFNVFMFLLAYCSFLFLIFHAQNYKTYAFWTISFCLLCSCLVGKWNLTVDLDLSLRILKDLPAKNFQFYCSLFLLIFPFFWAIWCRDFFLCILGLIYMLKENNTLEVFINPLFNVILDRDLLISNDINGFLAKLFYSILTLFWGIYLLKNNRIIISSFVFFSFVFIHYFNLIGDYISTSILFLISALVLLAFAYFRKRKNNV